ncbi:MAG: hypothetical protein RLZZ429_2102 [Bacteroidota bacterium]
MVHGQQRENNYHQLLWTIGNGLWSIKVTTPHSRIKIFTAKTTYLCDVFFNSIIGHFTDGR